MNREQTPDRPGVTGAVMALAGGAAPRAVTPAIVESPHLLTGVAAASPAEVWVVGTAGQQPLAARWDGASWTLPPGPPVEAALVGAGLQGIARLGSARAVGDTASNVVRLPRGGADGPPLAVAVGGAHDRLAGAEVPLIRHWNGSSWTAWSAPGPDRGLVLTAVAATGEGTAWAVGHGFPWGPVDGPVALRWTGSDWLPAPMPEVPLGKLLAVAGTAPDDVWAVGAAGREGLVMHYDGRAWSRVPSPATRFPLTGVAAPGPAEAWAVGRDRVLRWNGRKWSRVKAPVTAANTIAAPSPDDVWVAGGRGELAHFDGRRWTAAASPEPFATGAVWLASAATGPDGAVWLAGSRQVTRAGTMNGAPSITARSTDN
ncbi:WD40/YVTN/BNR-like repeat-containing protein [Spirillospora sp. CA-253888]